MSTLGELIKDLKDQSGRKAVYQTLHTFLTSRYIRRDDGTDTYQIADDDGSPVDEGVIYDIAEELEEKIHDLEAGIRSIKAEEI